MLLDPRATRQPDRAASRPGVPRAAGNDLSRGWQPSAPPLCVERRGRGPWFLVTSVQPVCTSSLRVPEGRNSYTYASVNDSLPPEGRAVASMRAIAARTRLADAVTVGATRSDPGEEATTRISPGSVGLLVADHGPSWWVAVFGFERQSRPGCNVGGFPWAQASHRQAGTSSSQNVG